MHTNRFLPFPDLFSLIGFSFCWFGGDAQELFKAYAPLFHTPRHYVCYYTKDSLSIDGLADEPAWQQVPWTEDFSDIEGGSRPQPPLRTRARMLWDKKNLYIYAELEEPDLWGRLKQHDTIIFEDNDFELFIDPANDTHHYFELEINSLGTVMDLFMAKPYRDGGNALMSWDAQGLRSAVKTKGTLNHPGDKDQGWAVEMAIPLSTLGFYNEKAPRDSALWRINFSRVEWDMESSEGAYRKRLDPATGRRYPEHNWVWSPQGIIDMHAPERWGYLQFSTRPAGSPAVAFISPVDEKARNYLWLIYYKQRDYRREHGYYALNLEDLGFHKMKDKDNPGQETKGQVQHAIEVDENGEVYTLTMESISHQFTATVETKAFAGRRSIDQDGKIGH
jgi:Carbohydrate family 9 binding domain-like